ncbi:hypothetical protein BH11MYX1_BH11MYX1_37410 [soil metagenome]
MANQLRVVTLNFWGTEAPLDARLAMAVQQLRELAPDVVCMQEVKPHAGSTTAHALAGELGMVARYQVASTWNAGEHGMASAGEEGLAILARAPLLDHRVLQLPGSAPGDPRILLSGQVATAGGPVWIHTTHLNYRLDDGVAREQQVDAIDAAIRAMGRGTTDAPQVLCGDFNATPDSDEIRFLRGLTTLSHRRTHFQDAWLRLHREPGPGEGPHQGITWSSENELTRPLRSLDIDRRIDYVFVTSRKKDGRGTVHACRVVLTAREDGICASDHYAVMADVQVVPS